MLDVYVRVILQTHFPLLATLQRYMLSYCTYHAMVGVYQMLVLSEALGVGMPSRTSTTPRKTPTSIFCRTFNGAGGNSIPFDRGWTNDMSPNNASSDLRRIAKSSSAADCRVVVAPGKQVGREVNGDKRNMPLAMLGVGGVGSISGTYKHQQCPFTAKQCRVD